MAESNQTKESFLNERAEIAKQKILNPTTFVNPDNRFFARTQSTPLEEQVKKKGFSLKERLAAAKNVPGKSNPTAGVAIFNPSAETEGIVSSFLSSSKPTGAEGNGETKPAPQNGTQTTTTPIFVPQAQTQTQTQTQIQAQTAQSQLKEGQTSLSSASQSFQMPIITPTPTTKPEVTTTNPPVSSATEKEKKSLKSKLRLTSDSFTGTGNAPGQGPQTGAPTTEPTTKSIPFVPATQTAVTTTEKKPTKTAEEKKTDKNNSPSKISLKTDFAPKGKSTLEAIPEKKEENKQETVQAKVEEKPVPVIENKKTEQPPQPTNEFVEVKPKKSKQDAKPEVRKYGGLSEKKGATEPQPVTKPTKEEQKPVEEPKKVEVKEAVKEEKVPEPKKVEEKPASPVKKEVKIEIVVMSRKEFTDAISRLAETLKGRPLPERFNKFANRDIVNDQRGNKQNRQNTGGPDSFNRGQKQRQEPPVEKPEGGFARGTDVKREAPAEPKLVRVGLSEEELKMKERLSKNVNRWISDMKTGVDPEEATRKEIKFNLNIITLDNFDVLKDKILDIASQKMENCQRVSDLIVENAWTQKQYVNTYAKLCEFLGKQDKLFFDGPSDSKEGKDPKKRKNAFKLQILKKIQTVFEEESEAGLGFKKPFEELDADDKALFLIKKKQRILGNVSFIGELYLEKFIVIGVVRIISNTLLTRFLKEYNEYMKAEVKPKNKFYEDTLEGLLKFYEIIGRAVEEKESVKTDGKGKEKESKTKGSNVVQNFQRVVQAINSGIPTENLPKLGEDEASLDNLFKIFDIMLDETNLTPRLDSLVKNLLYRKDNKWQAPLAKNQGPKTMRELHEEFEKEQVEAERRADEFREELRDSYYYNQPQKGNRNPRTEVVFQVAADKGERKQEESKYDASSINVDTNISFRPQRGKQDAKASDKPKFNYEQIEKDLKDIYKLASGEEVEDKTNPEEEIKKLTSKIGGKHVFKCFLKTFHDGRLDAIPKRLFIPRVLVETQSITEEDFVGLFQEALDKMNDVFCDAPNLDKDCARVWLDLCRKAGNGEPFNKFNFSREIYQGEEGEYILEFYQAFFQAILDHLEADYSDLKDKISQDNLKEFAKKIKFDY